MTPMFGKLLNVQSTAVVTGCAGFMGSHLTRHLLASGYSVVGIDNFSGGYVDWLPVNSDFQLIEADLADGYWMKSPELGRNISVVYHLAAYAAEGLSPFIRAHNYRNNLLATAQVVNFCVNRSAKLVFTSSMAVYGDQASPFSEDLRPSPIDPYGIAKYAAELDIASAAQQHQLRFSVVRPHNVVGIRQNIWDRYRNVLGIFVRRAIAGQPLQIFGSGDQVRAFSDVASYLKPLLMLANDGDGEVFNIGADQPVSIRQLAQLVVDAAAERGLDARIEHVEARFEVTEAFCDHSKAKGVLGFNDSTDLPTLVSQVIDWALTEPERPIRHMEYEVEAGMYSFWT